MESFTQAASMVVLPAAESGGDALCEGSARHPTPTTSQIPQMGRTESQGQRFSGGDRVGQFRL
jgi:hypothetical protein